MRFLLLLISSLLIATCAQAQTRGHDASLSTAAPASQDERLDQLFSRLKHERNEQAARLIAVQIGEEWAESGSANADLLMKWAGDAMKAKKYAVALDFLDQVVTLFPDYAEGWNRRATLHFMMGNYAKSMADIAETLEREPRHFGALSGMAGILESAGHDEEALEAYRRVLDIYPMMRSAQAEVTKLSDELTGEGI
jgi:tetratricopeptide (TPR) repeat protein